MQKFEYNTGYREKLTVEISGPDEDDRFTVHAVKTFTTGVKAEMVVNTLFDYTYRVYEGKRWALLTSTGWEEVDRSTVPTMITHSKVMYNSPVRRNRNVPKHFNRLTPVGPTVDEWLKMKGRKAN